MVPRTRVVLGLMILSLAAAVISGRQLFYNLTYAWVALMVVAFFWSRTAASGLEVRRQPFSTRGQVGHIFRERFFLHNKSRWTKLWVEIGDLTRIPGYRATALTGLGLVGPSDLVGHQGSYVADNLGRNQSESWDVRTICTRRGRYPLGPTEIRTSDPFGLFPLTQRLPVRQNVVVLPPIVRLRAMGVPSGRLSGGEAIRQQTHQLTPNASTIREYAPGDSLNRIHWKSTARLQRLIAKEFEFDPLADVWVLLDVWHRAHYEGDRIHRRSEPYSGPFPSPDDPTAGLPQSTMDYAATIAASLVFHFIQHDRNVGLIAYGRSRLVMQPSRGQSQLQKVLESLAVIEADGNYPIDEVAKIEVPRIPRSTTVFLISPSADAEVVEAAAALRALHRNPHLILIEPSSFGAREGSAALAEDASRRGLRTTLVRYGDSLPAALRSV
ncbi:MAG: DUF58 domain-containing protein [Anaerolineales bacterium]